METKMKPAGSATVSLFSFANSGGESEVSPIWQAAIDKYYEELRKGGVKGPIIDQDLWSVHSPDELLQQIQSAISTDNKNSTEWISRLKPVLLNLNDFAIVITLACGLNGQVAALIWGSMRLILKFAQPVLPELLDMLEELSRSLPRFRQYEEELPMTQELEDALFATYTKVIVLCAHSIAFFRNNPNLARGRNVWTRFSNEFSQVISDIRLCSRRVDEAADIIRLARETNVTETVKAIKTLQDDQAKGKNLPCYEIPFGLNLRFFGRSTEVDALKKDLDPQENDEHLKVISIYGIGGVGKTQLALHYANSSLHLYDAVVWIPAQTQIKITQALANFSTKLGLPKAEDGEDEYQSIQKVRDWLNTSKKKFLLIFDNVERPEILEQIWPASTKGSVIITCRSQSTATKRTSKTLHLQCFADNTGIEVLYSLTGIQPSNDKDADAAKNLFQLLGGFPLAMTQISEFMNDRGYSYEELLRLYNKSAQKIFARSEAPVQYEHTLNTVWEVSFQSLRVESRSLLNLLAFFDPDQIPEWILTNQRAGINEESLEFLLDEFDFGDAVIGLAKASLLSRFSAHKALSIHRLIQFTVLSRMSSAEKSLYLDNTVQMLYHSFPNTWNERTNQQGHGWASWETCSAILPHVSRLMELSKTHTLNPTDMELFAELIFRSGTYLWEKEQPTAAQLFFDFGLQLDISHSTRSYAQAYRLLGHIALDKAQPGSALRAYQKAVEIRQLFEEPESPPIAAVYESIACSYTEQGNVSDAFQFLSRAHDIHRAHNSQYTARMQAIYAMTYLRAGKPDEALAAIQECWKLQDLTELQIAESRYPKHSGDIVLLSKIKYAQGLKEEAQQLASRTITIRKGLFGNKGPRVADSTFIVSRMLEAQGEDVLAAKLLQTVVDMSRGMPEMQGHLSRSLWFLAKLEDKLGNNGVAEQLRTQAKNERNMIEGRETSDDDTDDAFMALVGWLLW